MMLYEKHRAMGIKFVRGIFTGNCIRVHMCTKKKLHKLLQNCKTFLADRFVLGKNALKCGSDTKVIKCDLVVPF